MPPCAFATLHGMEESNVKETQAEKIARIKRGLDAVPTLPGVYLWKDKDGQVIYVGKAKALKNRVSQYFHDPSNHNEKTRAMVAQIDHFDTIVAGSEFEALVLENSLIKRHKPRYNILLKDDKGYPYIRLSVKELYPRFSIQGKLADDGAKYFGPFGGRHDTQAILDAIRGALKLPTCGKKFPRDQGKERPCLNFHMGLCDGYCRKEMPRSQHQEAMAQAIRLLEGKFGQVEKDLREQMEEAAEALEFERAAALRDRLRRRGQPGRTVSVQDIAAAVSSRTGIPVGTISRTERQRLRTLEQTLSARVIGQEEAVHAAAEAVRRGRSGLAEQKRPAAAMLFLGPTGVGKTELCKALAEAVYGSEDAMIRVDMSEYMEKFTVSRLIGAPPGYIGHDEGGELSERVRRRPYSLVLFDELEKAHPDVCGLLLQVMEDGFLTDSGGRRIDFRNTMLVMTSNLGARTGGGLGFGAQAEDGALRSLREHFSPEFLGRIDCVARFQPLGTAALEQIAQQQLTALQQRAERLHVRLELPDGLARSFALRSRDGRGGAREIRRLVRHEMEAPLAALLLGGRVPERVRVDLRDDRPIFPAP